MLGCRHHDIDWRTVFFIGVIYCLTSGAWKEKDVDLFDFLNMLGSDYRR